VSLLLLFNGGGVLHTQNLSDSFTLSDSQPLQTVTKALSDSFSVTDTQPDQTVTKALSDSVTLTDALSTGHTLSLSDSFSVTDSQPLMTVTKVLSDSVSVTDTQPAQTVTKALSDSITVADAQPDQSVTKALSDTVTVTDSQPLQTVTKALSDSVTMGDSVAKTVDKAITGDTVSVTDTQPTTQVAFSLSDSFSVTDATPAKTIVKSLADTIFLTDAVAKTVTKVESDSVTLTDAIATVSRRDLTDSFSVTDSAPIVTLITNVFSMTPQSADFQAGAQVIMVGGALDMSPVSDDFSGAGISGVWTNASSGSGSVTPQPTNFTLVFDSGATAGSAALLRSAGQVFDVDAELTFRVTKDQRPPTGGAAIVYGEIALRISATTRVSIQATLDDLGRSVLAFTEVNGSQAVARTVLVAPTPNTVGVQTTLRLLRAGSMVFLFAGGQLMFSFDWHSDSANIEVGVRNDPVKTSEVTMSATGYVRRPVIVFGSVPMLDFVPRGTMHALGSSPSVPNNYDTVDLRITGFNPSAPLTLPKYFTFTRKTDLVQFDMGFGHSLTVTNDPSLSKRGGGS
jgi:hypothetical protein